MQQSSKARAPTLTMSCMAVFFFMHDAILPMERAFAFLVGVVNCPFLLGCQTCCMAFSASMVATSTPHLAVMCLRRGDYEADMHKLPEGERVCKEDVDGAVKRTAFSDQQTLLLPPRRAGPRELAGEPTSGTSPQSTGDKESRNGRCALAISFSCLNDSSS